MHYRHQCQSTFVLQKRSCLFLNIISWHCYTLVVWIKSAALSTQSCLLSFSFLIICLLGRETLLRLQFQCNHQSFVVFLLLQLQPPASHTYPVVPCSLVPVRFETDYCERSRTLKSKSHNNQKHISPNQHVADSKDRKCSVDEQCKIKLHYIYGISRISLITRWVQ